MPTMLSPELCRQARTLIADRLGLDFPEGRSADLERGLTRALRGWLEHSRQSSAHPHPLPSYLAWLAVEPDKSQEWKRLAMYLTVGETYFFRDRACFEALEQQVLPALIATRRSEGLRRVRLWSAGCSTGEEPYSLAILLDRLLPDRADWALTILATDMNPNALESAGRGLYREWSFRETPAWIRDRYFHRRGAETFEVDPAIRRMVAFAPLNLAEDGYPAMMTNTCAMDVIFCRNVLMYFTREAQRATMARFRQAMMEGGWLAVSPVEASAELFSPLAFAPVNFPGAMFYRKEEGGEGVRNHLSERPEGRCAQMVPDPLACLSEDARSQAGGRTAESPVTLPPEERVEVRSDPEAVIRRARSSADQGNLDEARRLCEAAAARDRLNSEAHLLLAEICQEQGDIPAAMEALRRAIYLAPDLTPAHFLLGSLLFRRGERKRGLRSMETVVCLLSSAPCDEAVPGSDGLTAGRLLEMAQAYMEMGMGDERATP
ncbi:MAG: tetratricopeptide repeat protein [Nitrospirae bacterium]|nr:tetratricopeptide repeat protein [Nitrospirota bacterium]